MGYTYKNITDKHQLIAVVNDAGTDVSHVPVGPGARIEVSRPTLDVYLPHVLARLNEAGNDITHIVMRQNEDYKTIRAADAKKMEQVPTPVTTTLPVPTDIKPLVLTPAEEKLPEPEEVPAPKVVTTASKKSKA
jgi:hypothetical protein